MAGAKHAEVALIQRQDLPDIQPLSNGHDDGVDKVNVRITVLAYDLGRAPIIRS